ncbi:MAG: HAAS signaling domain-containing protein [Acidimicrobiales bacterium]
MSDNDVDALVATYLRQLEQALGGLPAQRREQLLEEIRQHITEGRSRLAEEPPAAVRQLLERVGSPEDLAAAALEQEVDGAVRPRRAPSRWGRLLDDVTIALLLFGGALLAVGWLVGTLLLWTSSTWTKRDKVLGTAVVPGGFLLPALLFLSKKSTPTTTCAPSAPVLTLPISGHSGTAVVHCAGAAPAGPAWAVVTVAVVLVVASVAVASHLHRAVKEQRPSRPAGEPFARAVA